MPSNTIIFTGPTISKEEASTILDAIYLDPASQGDIYDAFLRYNPMYIGIIDGFFENIPSIWHKEILFVMSKGVHVFGSSSMGALRASELHLFGMIGIGEIFDAYKDYKLEDDDEVAVAHGPQELNYIALSEAMVNIRKTVSDALKQAIISPECSQIILEQAKSFYYKDRTYFNILENCKSFGKWDAELSKFLDWLPTNHRNIKKEDAINLLHEIKDFRKTLPNPKSVHYNFENTVFWVQSTSEGN